MGIMGIMGMMGVMGVMGRVAGALGHMKLHITKSYCKIILQNHGA